MSDDKDALKDLPTKSADAAAQAREQAKQYNSIFAPKTLRLDDGSTIEIPPHPSFRMFDDEAQAEYERFELELESYDRHPDIDVPEQKIYDANGHLQMTLEPTKRPGALKVPHRKTNPEGESKLLDPPYSVKVVQIALGDDDYAKLRAGKVNGRKGSAAAVWRLWNEQAADLAEREADDPKSEGSAVDSEAVSPPDSP